MCTAFFEIDTYMCCFDVNNLIVDVFFLFLEIRCEYVV